MSLVRQESGAVSGADISVILSALDRGSRMVRVYKRRKTPEKKIFSLKTDTFEIVQYPLTTKGNRSIPEDISEYTHTHTHTHTHIFYTQTQHNT